MNWLPQQRPVGYRKNYDNFVVPIHMTTYAEWFTKIGLAIAEIQLDRPIFAVLSKKMQL